VWDDHERALVDALYDWRADRHSCGQQLKESLHVEGRPDPDLIVGELTCLGCKAEAEWYASKSEGWARAHEKGLHPERWTLPLVMTRDEALERIKQQKG
jgi:hypothetical protein